MGYYQGDYYAGGRGGIGSFFKGRLGLASSFIPGVGGVVGKVLSKVARPAAAGMAATGASWVRVVPSRLAARQRS